MSIPEAFIESELIKSGVRIKRSHSGLMIVCPFHGDSDPSLSVSLGEKVPAGVWHCFGCHRSGTWNMLAERLNLRYWDEDSRSDVLYVNRTKVQIEERKERFELSEFTDSWSGYSSTFLRAFGVKRMWDYVNSDYYLYFPLTYLQEMYGYVRAKIYKSSAGPKYWFPSGMTKVLFPIDFMLNEACNVICLVEGVKDALRCIKYGIPALAVLGTHLTSLMREQLDVLSPQTIIFCMDGDEAGRRSLFGYISENNNRIPGLIKSLYDKYDIKVLFPPEPSLGDVPLLKSHDPDSMSYEYIQVLRRMVIQNNGTLLKNISTIGFNL